MKPPTEGERKVLNLAWQCFKTSPEVDYKTLAELANYKNPASATTCYLTAKKKLTTDPARLTDNDWKLLGKAFQCFKAMPQVDYAQLRALGGYKTSASATSVYLAARKKLIGTAHPPLLSNDGTAMRKRKRDVEGESIEAKPKKRGRKTAGVMVSSIKSEPIEAVEDADGETDLVAVKLEHTEDFVDPKLFVTAQEYLDQVEGHMQTDRGEDGEIFHTLEEDSDGGGESTSQS